MNDILKRLVKKAASFFGLTISRRKAEKAAHAREQGDLDPYPIKLHGFDVLLNAGNTYPDITRALPYFNAPLVELVNQAHAALGRPISFIDVGAATGDTVLLLEQRCAGKVGSYTCFEGDDEFEQLLRGNMRQFDAVRIIKTLLASERKSIPSLEKHHRGSASATGTNLRPAEPLDSFVREMAKGVDVLKIDVDGYDGEVLAGGKHLLEKFKPWVIFEWHPMLIERSGTDFARPFAVLHECGYRRLLWFDNSGSFSHFAEFPSPTTLEEWNRYLLMVNGRRRQHFDVIALPDTAPRVEVELAAMEYARHVSVTLPVQ